MIKRLNPSDITIRPFYTFKNWVIDTTTHDDLILTENGEYILTKWSENNGILFNTGALANQLQKYNLQQYPLEGIRKNGIFYATDDPFYIQNDNPINWNQSYKGVVFSTVENMFYRNDDTFLQTFGVENLGDDNDGKNENRNHLKNRISVLNVNQQVYGEKIKPKTVIIEDYSYRDDTYKIVDDGYTNLFFNDKYFYSVDHIQPPSRSLGYTNLYDVQLERVGTSLSADSHYLLVGSPMDDDSLSYDKNGKAFLYRYDTSSLVYRPIKTFESPFTQNGFVTEQGWDYTNLIKTEIGTFLLPEEAEYLNDQFSISVSINGNFIAIGSPSASYDGNLKNSHGQVFVYDKYKGGFDHWGIINILEGSSSGDRFGSSVDISGSLMAVGAEGAYDRKGAVYIYEKRVYGKTLPTESFWYHAVSENNIALNLLSENDYQIMSEMETPYFINGNNVWILQHVITGSNWKSGDQYGGNVKLKNDILIVSSKQINYTSSVDIFQYDKNKIGTGIYDTASFVTPIGDNAFGIGSWEKIYEINQTGIYSGSTYFTHSVDLLERTNYFDNTLVYPISKNYNGFGYSIDINDNFIAIGCPFDRTFMEYSGSQKIYNAGATYIFQMSQSRYQMVASLKGDEFDTVDNRFGISVSLNDSNKLAIGSPIYPYKTYNNYNTSSLEFVMNDLYTGARNANSIDFYSGKTFLYQYVSSSHWEKEKETKRVKYAGEPKTQYGTSVALTENALFVGAPVNTTSDVNNLSPIFIRENVPSFITGSVFKYNLEDLENVPQVGNVFYRNGILTNTLTQSLFENIFHGNVVYNTDMFGYSMSFQSTHVIYEKEIMCSVQPGEFNISTNPTALVNDPIYYDIDKKGTFSYFDTQLISNYILGKSKYMKSGSIDVQEIFDDGMLLLNSRESWWKDDLILLESEDTILLESYQESTIITGSLSYTEYFYEIKNLDDNGLLDVNGDGKTDHKDATLIVRYFLGFGGNKLTSGCVDENCVRRYDHEIRKFLDRMTGKNNGKYIKPEFLNYQESASLDKTGSYLAPYVSQIGLYQDNMLVAVAKLAKPIKISGDYPINFNIKMDF